MDLGKKVLKIGMLSEAVRVEDPIEVQKRREAEAVDILEDARRRSERILADCFETMRREKDQLRAEKEAAIAEIEGKRQEIFDELAAAAQKQAEDQINNEIRPRLEGAVASFGALVQETEKVLGETLTLHQNEMVDLALRIAEVVVGSVVSEKSDLVKRTAVRCIEQASDRQEMVIRVHPEDLDVLREYELQLIERFDDLKKIEIEEDRRVDRGGVWIETPSGLVDGRLRTQVEEIFRCVLPNSELPMQSVKPEEPKEKGEDRKELDD